MASDTIQTPALTWQGVDLPRVPPGNYGAACVGWQGPEWVRSIRRWSLRLEFSLLSDGCLVSAFYNFGSDLQKPSIGRRSRFYAAWAMANGEAPRKGQRMSLETFTEPGLRYLVRVEDSTTDGKGEAKPTALIYSKVADILNVERP